MFAPVPYDHWSWGRGPGHDPGDTWELGPEAGHPTPRVRRRPPGDRLLSARRRALKFLVDVGRRAARSEVLSHASNCLSVELDAILAELVAAGLIERREVQEVMRNRGGGRVTVVQYRPAAGAGDP